MKRLQSAMAGGGSLSLRLAAGAAAVAMLVGAQLTIIRSQSQASIDHVEEARDVGVRSALLGERIKFDVVQVQQWLTDISATRGLDGLNDGFEVAAEFAIDFDAAAAELADLKPELEGELTELREVFATYHAVGIEMAEAYVAGGPEAGNQMMPVFDAAAASMGESVEALEGDLLAASDASLDSAVSSAETVQTVALVASLATGALIFGAVALIVRSILSQLSRLSTAAKEISAGNLNVEPLPAHDRDSLGRLAGSFNDMTAMLGSVDAQAERIASGDVGTPHSIPGDLGRAVSSMTDSLATMVDRLRSSATQMSTAASELTEVSAHVGQSAEQTASEASSASTVGEDLSDRVGAVASVIGQMNASITEVATSASEAATVATEAVDVAHHTAITISKLGESSEEIGNVIKVINSIAEQTNLLALNATIEAARAGEAGKGFAVVANEVKDLADQTAGATQEISRRVHAIQADTTDAVEANSRIGETIDRINEISTTIASAVEEQSVTTAQIGRNIEEAAVGTRDIADSISGLAEVAADTTQSTTRTKDAAEDMQRLADDLNQLVGQYH